MTRDYVLYTVEKHGHEIYHNHNLTACLRFIGRDILGRAFGGMRITVAEAIKRGYQINRA